MSRTAISPSWIHNEDTGRGNDEIYKNLCTLVPRRLITKLVREHHKAKNKRVTRNVPEGTQAALIELEEMFHEEENADLQDQDPDQFYEKLKSLDETINDEEVEEWIFEPMNGSELKKFVAEDVDNIVSYLVAWWINTLLMCEEFPGSPLGSLLNRQLIYPSIPNRYHKKFSDFTSWEKYTKSALFHRVNYCMEGDEEIVEKILNAFAKNLKKAIKKNNNLVVNANVLEYRLGTPVFHYLVVKKLKTSQANCHYRLVWVHEDSLKKLS